jgi:methyl-accepting chemotaxis protein
MEKLLKKPLGKNFPGFWKIFSGIKGKRESRGYYTWQDKDKRFRDKFMVCTPVQGTRYVIAATTYMDEFTLPMQNLEAQARELKEKSRYVAIGIVGATLLLILLVVSVYGHRLSGRIRSMTEVAERISVGDLDIEIESTSRDEIGELSEAISRMQESIRLSIERLRRRR